MTPEAINQAMAELDGWKYPVDMTPLAGYNPHGICKGVAPIYTKDLNAVARVVGKLSSAHRFKYLDILVLALDGIGPFECIDATAPQRCEAILRACGKWVEG